MQSYQSDSAGVGVSKKSTVCVDSALSMPWNHMTFGLRTRLATYGDIASTIGTGKMTSCSLINVSD